MATSAVLLFKNSAPQSMQKKKHYDEEKKFADDDLQDVLDGLLKLGVSDTNNTNTHKHTPNHNRSMKPHHSNLISPFPTHHTTHILPRSKSTPRTHSHSNKSKPLSQTSSPNRYNPAYQQPLSFIASSKHYTPHPFTGFNLLYEAAKKVEGVSHFKIDIADIDRITHTIDDSQTENELIYNKDTGVLRKKSKNGISPPKIRSINELMPDTNTTLTFHDLNDDFTVNMGRISDVSSINPNRRSNLFISPNKSGLSLRAQKSENRRLSREWSNQSIQEMDRIYKDKSKLAQKLEFEKEQKIETIEESENLNNSSVLICQEFSESNTGLAEVVNKYKTNVSNVKEHQKHREQMRDKQNALLLQQLSIMQQKIAKQERKEKEFKIQRIKIEKELADKQKRELAIAAANAQKKSESKSNSTAVQGTIVQETSANNSSAQNVQVSSATDEKQEWYPYCNELGTVNKQYKAMYKQCVSLMESLESNSSALFGELEMHIGLIVRSISSNQKSVFNAFKRFQKLVDSKTKKDTNERRFCFVQITELVVSDVRIVKSSAQKFASAYFLSFVMNEYCSEYLEIFKCVFYHNCVWTMPYIDKQLRDYTFKNAGFDNNKPSIIRCVVLGYQSIKKIESVPSEKRKFLQVFEKNNNAGQSVFESENKYFTRTQHICGLFAAFMSIRDNNQFKNPFGIDSQHCWKWIAQLLALPSCVYPELCSILSGIIGIIGYDMLEKYPKQFPKIVKFIFENIWPKCQEDTTARGKAKRELNLFLRECVESMKKNNGKLIINKPKDSELIAKTVGASALTNIQERRRY